MAPYLSHLEGREEEFRTLGSLADNTITDCISALIIVSIRIAADFFVEIDTTPLVVVLSLGGHTS